MKNRLILKLLFVLLTFTSVAQVSKSVEGVSIDRLTRLENFVKDEISKGNIPGAVTMIMRNGKIIHHSALGFKDVNENVLMDKNDLFYIQSMTKPIITVAFMMLYEEGYFSLTDPISKFIPSFKKVRVAKDLSKGLASPTDSLESEITIAQILSHTSGLTHGLGSNPYELEFRKAYFKPWSTIEQRASSITNFPLLGQPGKQWRYSAGPDVISMLIEKFSGMSTQEFLSQRIFQPLGMDDTGYNLTKAQLARVVKLHSKSPTGGPIKLSAMQPKAEGVTLFSGVNGLYSSAKDYGIFCQMLINGGKSNGKQLLSRKTVDLMTTNHAGSLFSRAGEGFGLGFAVVTDVGATKLPGSNGLFYWSGANNTHFFIDPKEHLIALFLTQESNHTIMYHDRLRQLVYQALVD